MTVILMNNLSTVLNLTVTCTNLYCTIKEIREETWQHLSLVFRALTSSYHDCHLGTSGLFTQLGTFLSKKKKKKRTIRLQAKCLGWLIDTLKSCHSIADNM